MMAIFTNIVFVSLQNVANAKGDLKLSEVFFSVGFFNTFVNRFLV